MKHSIGKLLTLRHLAPPVLSCLVVLPYLEKAFRPIPGSGFTRIDLLAYSWDFPVKAIVTIFVVSFLTVLFGSTLILSPLRRRSVFASMFFLTLGLSLPHVIISPPFETPDEPDHFLGFIGGAENRDELLKSAAELSLQGQLTRIYNSPDLKFLPGDILRRVKIDWMPHMTATVMLNRSPLTDVLWRGIRLLFNTGHANVLLLGLRIFHGLVFCFAVATLSTSTAAFLADERVGYLVGFCLLLVPSLPFFGMHVSNYAFLTSFYVLSSAIVPLSIRLVSKQSRGHIYLFGILFALLALSPILGAASALSFLVFPVLFGATIFVLKTFTARSDSAHFLMAVLVGIVGFLTVALPGLTALPSVISDMVNQAPRILVNRAALEIATILFFSLLIALLYIAIIRARKSSLNLTGLPNKCLRISHYFLLIFAALLILWAQIGPPDLQPNIEIQHQMTKWLYIRSSIKKYFLNYASLRSDFYLCSSFWGGFGWLEIPMQHSFLLWPKVMVPIFITVGSLNSIGCQNRNASGIKSAGAIFAMNSFCGASFAISLTAAAVFVESVNLHGRYLIGVEVLLLVSSAIYASPAFSNWPKQKFFFWLLLFVCALRAITYKFILNRYF